VIGIQKFAPVVPKPGTLSTINEQVLEWEKIIEKHISNSKIKYAKVGSATMQTLYIAIYAKEEDFSGKINQIVVGKVKASQNSQGVIKGSVMMSFRIGGTSFCMMNCHLTNGIGEYTKRFNEMRTIYYSHIGKDLEKSVPAHDIKFLFGDLNFRLELDRITAGSMVRRKEYEEMLSHDQLWNQYSNFNFLPALIEESIGFPPTYKFLKGTNGYDTENKSPAWYFQYNQ